MSDIQKDLEAYVDQWGLVQPKAGQTSGNGLLYTAEAIAAYIANDALDENAKQRFLNAYGACEIQPGLFHRRPDGGFGQNQQDDYIGIAYAARYLNEPDMAKRILDYGSEGVKELQLLPDNDTVTAYNILSLFGLLKVKRVYNNSEPGKFGLKAWFARWPLMFVNLKFAANQDPWLIEKLYWCVVQILSCKADPNNHDSWILSWLSWKTVEGKSWICDLAGKYWLKKFQEKQGDMGSLLERYFNDVNQPLAKYLKGIS